MDRLPPCGEDEQCVLRFSGKVQTKADQEGCCGESGKNRSGHERRSKISLVSTARSASTAVAIFEAQNEKADMKMAIQRGEAMTLETMVAVPIEKARELVEPVKVVILLSGHI
jgi:hypothetical protein